MAEVVKARAEIAEAHAVMQVDLLKKKVRIFEVPSTTRIHHNRHFRKLTAVSHTHAHLTQAEFAIYKQQANMPKQIEEQVYLFFYKRVCACTYV